MTEKERDEIEGAALLEYSRTKQALAHHILQVEQDVTALRDVIEAERQESLTTKDGKLYSKAESIVLRLPAEETIVQHVQAREDLREKIRAIQGQLIRLGLPC